MPDTPETLENRPPGRFRAAWMALMGHPVVPAQIRGEWAAWQLELEAICDKIGAAANRMNTRHKRDLDRALAELEEVKAGPDTPRDHAASGYGWNPEKRAMNRALMASRGKRIPTMNGVDDEHGAEAGTGGTPD